MGIRDPKLWLAGAALWGFAEATFFFIVPDVLLTAAVLVFGLARAFRLAVVSAFSASAGGLIMIIWGAGDIDGARTFLLGVPLIGDDLIHRVSAEMNGAWPVNMTLGAVTGAPYKIYAVEAGGAGVNPLLFAIVSFGARLMRFTLAIGIAAGGFALAQRLGLARLNAAGLALVWAGLYAAYVWIRVSAN
ncbi:hypothetical protein [Hyphococcus sp.]|uniref:hypothetical protein n=1 Tax=Hyphococcus sp. TaxID=2038636 RepID=UPI003CCC07B3